MVTGGLDGSEHILDSTELLTQGASEWVFGGVLPSPRGRLVAATLDNRVIVSGSSSTQ